MHTAQSLRSEYPHFSYDGYSWSHRDSKLLFSFEYSIADHSFKHKVHISNVSASLYKTLDKKALKQYCFQLGLFESLSYWKLTASPTYQCHADYLSLEQKKWWYKLILKGMGEYFFVNNIDFTEKDFLTIESSEEKSKKPHLQQKQNTPSQPSLLLPIGGGKDSATTIGLLQQHTDLSLTALLINPTQAAIEVTQVAKLDCIQVTRTFDPLLFALTSQGYLNGHIPISSVIAMISCVVGYIFGHTHVVLANESSANEGNVLFKGQEINHQYSKTFEFETDFQKYSQNYFPATPFYFSFLRPLNELQIGKLFSQYPLFHPKFKSCNRGSKENKWCCKCSKCLFAWCMLYPFFETDQLSQLFGENLYKNPALWPVLTSLVKKNEGKPFDCVGTKEETLVSLYLAIKKHNWILLPTLLHTAKNELIESEVNLDDRANKILFDWNPDHAVPDFLLPILEQVQKNQ